MVNTHGQIIGVNVAYETTPSTETPNGTGYAIPINTALAVVRQILSDGAQPGGHPDN